MNPHPLYLLMGCSLLLTFVWNPPGYSRWNAFQFLCLGSGKIERNIATDKTSQAIASFYFFYFSVQSFQNFSVQSLINFYARTLRKNCIQSMRNFLTNLSINSSFCLFCSYLCSFNPFETFCLSAQDKSSKDHVLSPHVIY